MADAAAGESSIRLDKWLWHARVVRTRTLAKKLVEAGKVRLNRAKVHSASHGVRVGDVLTIVLPRAVLVYEIVGIAERRESFAEASKLYVDLSTPSDAPESGTTRPPDAPNLKRPEGRERRLARRLAGKPG